MRPITILAFLFAPLLALADPPAEKPNTVLIHPGDALYARFDESGPELKLVSVTKEKNEQAQLMLKMDPFDQNARLLMLTVKSNFKKDLLYKAEMRLLSKNRRQETSLVPVRAGKTSFESWPHPIEELALYGFALKP